jgi:hypothetical protein
MSAGGAPILAPPTATIEGPHAWAATCRGQSWPPHPLGSKGKGAATGKHGEQRGGAIP